MRAGVQGSHSSLPGCRFPRNGLEQVLDSDDFIGYSGNSCKHDLEEYDAIVSKFQQFAIAIPVYLQ